MRYIEWFWVSAGLFLLGMLASIISGYLADVPSVICRISGVGLNIAGWITYTIAWFKR